jgi:cysteine desulfurase/selenocysteine lyase
MDLTRIRADTRCRSIYLDHTAASVPPAPVFAAMRTYLDEIEEFGPKSFTLIDRHYRQLEHTRAALARIIGAEGPDTIALFTSGSEAIAAAATALPWQPEDEIIISEAEMISNVAPWLRIRDRFGTRVRVAPLDASGVVDVDRLEAILSPRTRLISMTHVANSFGVIQPLERVGQLARAAGALFLVDASASVGVVSVDVARLQCDLLAASGRKYLRGPSGAAFLYCARHVVGRLEPMAFGWKSGAWNWNDQTLAFLPDAARFHSGEPNFGPWIGLGVAASYALELGIDPIARRVRELSAALIDRLAGLPNVRLVGPAGVDRRNGIIMADVAGIPPKAAADYLQARGVIAEGGHGYAPGPLRLSGLPTALRLALHYWNTVDELDVVVGLLARLKP